MIIPYFSLLSIILFPTVVLKHFSFCKSSQIGNARIPEESLGERRKGCSWGRWWGQNGAGGRGLWQSSKAAESQHFWELLTQTFLNVRDWETGKEHLLFQHCVYLIWPQPSPSLWPHLAGHTSSSAPFGPASLQDTTPRQLEVPVKCRTKSQDHNLGSSHSSADTQVNSIRIQTYVII